MESYKKSHTIEETEKLIQELEKSMDVLKAFKSDDGTTELNRLRALSELSMIRAELTLDTMIDKEKKTPAFKVIEGGKS